MMIRGYEPRDSERLYEILCSSLDESYDPAMLSYFHMQWPGGQFVACDHAGRPIGFLSSSKINPAHAKIMLFAVDRNYRSMGAGAALLIRLKQAAMMNGIIHLSLEVRQSNMRAVNFYKRHGFVPTEVLPDFYNDGSSALRMDAIVN